MNESKQNALPSVYALRFDGKGGAVAVEPATAVAEPAATWVHVNFSDPKAADWAWNESGLDPVIVGVMLDPESRPRALPHGNGVLASLRGVNLNPGARLEDMISVRIWIEPGRVVTASRRQLRSLREIRESIDQGVGPTSPAQFVLELVDRLNHFISQAIEQIEEQIDQAEDTASVDRSLSRNSAFNQLRRQTAQIRRYLSPQREALDRLSRFNDPLFSAAEVVELREQLNALTLALEDLDLVRERALVAQEEFLGLLAHEQNSRMLLLSIVTAIFLPLSFLTGLFGMNVAGLPGLEYPGSFLIIALIMVVTAIVILAIFRRKRWL